MLRFRLMVRRCWWVLRLRLEGRGGRGCSFGELVDGVCRRCCRVSVWSRRASGAGRLRRRLGLVSRCRLMGIRRWLGAGGIGRRLGLCGCLCGRGQCGGCRRGLLRGGARLGRRGSVRAWRCRRRGVWWLSARPMTGRCRGRFCRMGVGRSGCFVVSASTGCGTAESWSGRGVVVRRVRFFGGALG